MSQHNNQGPKIHVEADEKHLLLDHNYDNIQELNHPLPAWWNAILYVSIAFSIGYFVYYHLMGGPSLKDEFNKDYSRVVAVQEEFKRLNSAFKPEMYESVVNSDGVKKGVEVYEMNCLPCHAEGGKGDIGPNLTDDHWIVARGTPETIYNVVFNGSEANGMPPWGDVLTQEEIYQAVSFVMSLKNTFVSGGKEPQGEKVEE